MKACAVISEFNPFHNGHKYLLEEIRKKGYDTVVCIMSGNFVQRGEYAAFDKKLRAKAAVEGGADLVLSIPFPWCCAGAEFFSRAAVKIISDMGNIEALGFGTESGDIDGLRKCADYVSFLSLDDVIKYQKENPKLSYAQARKQIVEKSLGSDYAELLSSPNNILAIEYLKALKYFKPDIIPLAVRRVLASHNGKTFSSDFCSSSYIRTLAVDSNFDEIMKYVPWRGVISENDYIQIDYNSYFQYLKGAVLSRTPQEISICAENGGGFEYVIMREIINCDNYEIFSEKLRSRHITDAKIRRALLFIACGVKMENINIYPEFTEVLAFNDKGRSFLADCRKKSKISIISKTANLKKYSDIVNLQFDLQRKAETIFQSFINRKT